MKLCLPCKGKESLKKLKNTPFHSLKDSIVSVQPKLETLFEQFHTLCSSCATEAPRRHTVHVPAPEPCDCKLWPGARNISSFAKRGLCSELWGSAVQLEIHDNRITSNIAIVEVYTSSKKWVEILSERSISFFTYTWVFTRYQWNVCGITG